MSIKKSALLMIVLSASSVGLLVYSSAITPMPTITIPIDPTPKKSCSQLNECKPYPSWDMISQIMLRSAA